MLTLPEEEEWRKHRLGLVQSPQSCSFLEPEALTDPLVSRTASYDALYELRSQERKSSLGLDGGSTFDVGQSQLIPVSPEVIKRRRGGLIEQRDIIKAHEAHKMQSTPQARRKEWEDKKCTPYGAGITSSCTAKHRTLVIVAGGKQIHSRELPYAEIPSLGNFFVFCFLESISQVVGYPERSRWEPVQDAFSKMCPRPIDFEGAAMSSLIPTSKSHYSLTPSTLARISDNLDILILGDGHNSSYKLNKLSQL
ncbi:hypothetical protein lerEdw1_002554 [Lerista edwardsae]|nr:hypothetical protein lerEdw1_002554 [Lerista edwardsae]